MRRREEWARPEWRQKVRKAVERASVERDSSEELIESADREFKKLRELLREAGAASAVLRRAEGEQPAAS